MSAEAGTEQQTDGFGLPYGPPAFPAFPAVSRETSPDDAPELLDANQIAESLTGFDEIAIEQWFKAPFSTIAHDQLKLLRSLYFIHLRRAEGATDKAAWRTSMEMPLSELKAQFLEEDDGADPDDDVARGERDRAYAEFVMVSGVPYTVEEYNGLTLAQKNAVYEVASKRK
jgi:hypothetical protein